MRINHFLPQPRFRRFLCYPESFGHYKNEPAHAELREQGRFAAYNLHIVLAGRGYVELGGRKTALEAGQGFLYGPGLEQNYCADAEDPWEVGWVHFVGPAVPLLLQGKGEGEPWLFFWRGRPEIEALWKRLLEGGIPSLSSGEASVSALLYELLAELAQHGEEAGENAAGVQRSRFLEAAEWIREHSREPLALPQMAKAAGCSMSHFSRRFHVVIGSSPIQFLTECRVLHAKRLLVSTKLTIKAIAETAGFAESSYFIQVFRRSEGMTPDQFRKLRG
ncbi:helix-turn-helix domain-containing protein [Paenibacillus sp. CAU 1782]